MINQSLHKTVGDLLKEFAEKNKQNGFKERLDPACGGEQYISLFFDPSIKALETRLCCVDAMLLKNDKIAAIIEIEESDIKPTQICGKYLTTALSKAYSHTKTNEHIIMEEHSIDFIQILDISSPHKKKQAENIEKAIRSNLCGCVKKYDVICINWEEEGDSDKLEAELYKILNEHRG